MESVIEPATAAAAAASFWQIPVDLLLAQLQTRHDGLLSSEAVGPPDDLTSSNFGNTLGMAGSSLFLAFLPMLSVEILLNNLLYDFSERPIPLNRVDDEYLAHPRQWDMHFIRNFILVVGPVSSIFDFLTFYLMLTVFHASEALFHTGWFVESIATQALVIFIIRN